MGFFEIRPSRSEPGRWEVWFSDKQLGSYATPTEAAEDLAGGHSLRSFGGIDPGTLSISSVLGDWEHLSS